MIAKFPGSCSSCRSRFNAGATVDYDRATKRITGCPACRAGAVKLTDPADLGQEPTPAAPAAPVLPTPGREEARAAAEALLARLDSNQRAVAGWTPETGNVQVIAAAGSGKTTTVVALVARLLWQGLLAAGEIVVTTFTNKAARELRERLARVVPPGALDPSGSAAPGTLRVGTFHGLALRALRQTDAGRARFDMSRCLDANARTRSAGIPSTGMLWAQILGYAGEAGLPGTGIPGLDLDEPDARAYSLAVDVARSQGLDDAGTRAFLRETEEGGLAYLVDAYGLYTDVKRALGAWDFADAIAAYNAGLADGSIRDGARLVVVDESQDTARVQYAIAEKLARAGALMLVGDGRQSIYGWRGAAPALFLEAQTRFEAAPREIPTNYRSAREIVAIGNRVSDGKAWSIGSPSKAAREVEGTVTVAGHDDPAAEAFAVAEEISTALAGGASADDFAILTRTNAAAGAFEAALVSAKVPCAVVGGTPFFERREVKDVLAYVRLATGSNEIEHLGRIVNRPKRFLGKKFVAAVEGAMAAGGGLLAALDVASAKLAPRQRGAARDLRALLGSLRAAEWHTALDRIATLLAPAESDAGEADDDRSGIPAAVAAIAKGFENAEAFLAFAARCGGAVEKVAEGEKTPGRVTISTIHKAKGLEWGTVFVSASAGTFPHSRASALDEEERLFYVAVTRAKDTLHLTYADVNLRGQPAGASVFLSYATPDFSDEPPQGPQGGGEPAPVAAVEPAPQPAPESMHGAADGFGGTDFPQPDAVVAVGDSAGVRAEVEAARAAGVPVVERQALGEQPSLTGVPQARWTEARRFAEVETEKEPRASVGAGGRYVQPTLADFEVLLAPVGFVRADREVEAKVHQRVLQACVGHDEDGIVWCRVYTSIGLGDEEAREVGEDSIKVSLIRETMDGKSRPLSRRLSYATRTRGWRVTVLKRIDEVLAPLGAPCPKCGAATVERERNDKSGKFHGCVRYPACAGVAKV